MHTLTVIAAVLISVAVLVHLARSDPKRRRVFGLPDYEGRRWTKASLAILAAPGLLLLVSGDAAGFTVWLGALTVTGWGVAALSPQRSAALGNAFTRAFGHAGGALTAAATGVGDFIRTIQGLHRAFQDSTTRIDALEMRVAELEAELTRLKGEEQRPDHAA